MPGIRDVAEKAGVGVGTVSRALNGTGYVSKDAKEKILKVAEEMGYSPNELARNFTKNRSGIVGIVVPDIENPFFAKFLKNTEFELFKHGYKGLVCNTIGISSRLEEMLEMTKRNMLDGLIVGTDAPANFNLDTVKKPIVSLDRNWGPKIPVITSDNEKGAKLVFEKVISSGAKKILVFEGKPSISQPFDPREATLINNLKSHGVEVIIAQIEWNVVSYEYYLRVAEEYLPFIQNVDAIFAADLIAIACMAIALQNGIKIPEQLKIIGYDGINLTKLMAPPLTTIRQDIGLMAQKCVNTFLSLQNGEQDIPHIQICDVNLIQGGTL